MQPGTTQTDHSVWTRPPTASEPSGRDATPPLVPASMFLRTPASTHFISKWPRLAASLHPSPTAVSMDRRRCAAGSQLAQKSPLAGRPCERCHPPRNNAEEAPERVRCPGSHVFDVSGVRSSTSDHASHALVQAAPREEAPQHGSPDPAAGSPPSDDADLDAAQLDSARAEMACSRLCPDPCYGMRLRHYHSLLRWPLRCQHPQQNLRFAATGSSANGRGLPQSSDCIPLHGIQQKISPTDAEPTTPISFPHFTDW